MIRSFTLPAGTYYIGDPYYIFPNRGPYKDLWDELLEACDYFSGTCFVEIPPDIKVWAHSTKYGGGVYSSNINKRFFVDSGLLGIIPIDKPDKFLDVDFDFAEKVGLIHKFETPFEIELGENDRFLFGDICIFDEF